MVKRRASSNQAQSAVYPVLLSGGSGTRLWPLSRPAKPKQLLQLTGEQTMLQQAALRVLEPGRFMPLTIIAGDRHADAIKRQMREIDAPAVSLLLEPFGRDTAAATAIAALHIGRLDPEGVILLVSADHHIPDTPAFQSAVAAGVEIVQSATIALFGMRPSAPATNYGYIRLGERIAGTSGAYRIAEYVEKPPKEMARRFLDSGEYLWNSGMFMFQSELMLAELQRHAPDVIRSAQSAFERSSMDNGVLHLDAEAFGRCPAISLDYAVMEKTDRASVLAADFAWADIGSWTALAEIAPRDQAGNTIVGNVMIDATSRSYIRSDGPLVATVGVEDLIVVVANNEVLVARRDCDQAVKQIAERIRSRDKLNST